MTQSESLVAHQPGAWVLPAAEMSSMLGPSPVLRRRVQHLGPRVCSRIPPWLVSLMGSRK